VIAVERCPCIYESGFETHSIHSTLAGAVRRMGEIKKEDFDELAQGAHYLNTIYKSVLIENNLFIKELKWNLMLHE